ncbi:inorganic phosphate transporter [Thiohalorhabdus sp. Cl-TMA]|uniref:Anion permease n=1 Tax=Thiohalorhabdus methylotrophus TaxID=3242694 RepID=A0ABV4TWI6_9GAMM
MEILLLFLGLGTAVFAGVNSGGSSIGESFGPATGSGIISPRAAGVLMVPSVLLGGYLVGPHVVETLGTKFVPEEVMTLPVATAVLLFTGLGILFGNLRAVSVSTSETAVGAVAGVGAALGVLNWETLGVVVSWWLVSPLLALLISGFVGRYWYRPLKRWLNESGRLRRSALPPLLILGACYMGFSAGASNVANAVAPLVGAGSLAMSPAILLAATAMAAGGFLFGPRTMRTVGVEITDLSVVGALLTMVIAATIITLLSYGGIPASLAITAVTCVIGLGWGRASRNDGDQAEEARFSRATTARIILTWTGSPIIAFLPSYLLFSGAAAAGWL